MSFIEKAKKKLGLTDSDKGNDEKAADQTGSSTIDKKAEAVKADVAKTENEPGTEEWRTAMDAVISKIEELDSLVDERSSLLRGLGGEA